MSIKLYNKNKHFLNVTSLSLVSLSSYNFFNVLFKKNVLKKGILIYGVPLVFQMFFLELFLWFIQSSKNVKVI